MVFQLLVFVVSCRAWVSLAFQSLLSVAFHGSLVVGSIVFVLSLGQSPAFSSALAVPPGRGVCGQRLLLVFSVAQQPTTTTGSF